MGKCIFRAAEHHVTDAEIVIPQVAHYVFNTHWNCTVPEGLVLSCLQIWPIRSFSIRGWAESCFTLSGKINLFTFSYMSWIGFCVHLLHQTILQHLWQVFPALLASSLWWPPFTTDSPVDVHGLILVLWYSSNPWRRKSATVQCHWDSVFFFKDTSVGWMFALTGIIWV